MEHVIRGGADSNQVKNERGAFKLELYCGLDCVSYPPKDILQY